MKKAGRTRQHQGQSQGGNSDPMKENWQWTDSFIPGPNYRAVCWFVPGTLDMKVQAYKTNFRDHLMVPVNSAEALFASPAKGGKGW